jgi:hypothetical protein
MTLLPTFIIEYKAKFQLEIIEYKVVNFSLSNFTDPLISIHGPPRGPYTPGYERLVQKFIVAPDHTQRHTHTR